MNLGSTQPCIRIWACRRGRGVLALGIHIGFRLAFGFDDVVLVGGREQVRGVGLAFGVVFVLVGAEVGRRQA